jgi:hypothetical protein
MALRVVDGGMGGWGGVKIVEGKERMFLYIEGIGKLSSRDDWRYSRLPPTRPLARPHARAHPETQRGRGRDTDLVGWGWLGSGWLTREGHLFN